MNKKIFLLCASVLSLLAANSLRAQVLGSALNVGADYEYQWLDKHLNIDNAMLWGVHAGFSFGPIVELRGTYDRSFGIKSKLQGNNEWNIDKTLVDKMGNRKIDIERYGTELKFNLFDGTIAAPYIGVGGGIQNIRFELPKSDGDAIELQKTSNFYVSGIAGLKFNLAPRIVLTVSGKYLGFQIDKTNPYVSLDAKAGKNGLVQMHNFSAMAGATFYLSGIDRNRDEIERAYHNFFSNGYRGWVFTVEPSFMYVNFSDKSSFEDRYFYGGQVGVDFNSTFGIRGFYYQANEPGKKMTFNLDKNMGMYGGYFTGRLNLPRGITPYVNIGAGYMDVDLKKAPTEADKKNMGDAVFALGGVGIEVPLFRFLSAFGSVNAIVHPKKGVETTAIKEHSQIIYDNYGWQAGLRMNFGSFAREENRTEAAVDNNSINEIREEYREYQYIDRDSKATDGNVVRVTASDIDRMAQRVIDRNRQKSGNCGDSHLTPLERELVHALIMGTPVGQTRLMQPLAVQDVQQDNTDKILDRIDEMEQKIDRNNEMLRSNAVPQQPTTTVITTGSATTTPAHPAYVAQEQGVATDGAQNNSFVYSGPRFNSVGLLVGANFVTPKAEGDRTIFAGTVGVRGYMPISNTNLDFIPEAFVGFGSKTTHGIAANVAYNFRFNSLGKFVPYVGAGVGFYTGTNPGVNMMIGTAYQLSNGGALFVDYGTRHTFRNHSLSVGYRFYF